MISYSPAEIAALLPHCTPEERAEIIEIIENDSAIWRPLPGPQSLAYHCLADVLGFGGSAGGGKTDLAIGKALTQHTVTAFFRREGTELTAVEDRIREIVGNDRGYNGQKRIWRNPVPGVKQLEFGSVPNAGDETKYQGRPKDLLVLDEAANFIENQVRFLMGWVRSVKKAQRKQTLMCFNPPTTSEGRWIVDFFGPWLDDKHPLPASPGELRYFAMIAGHEIETPDARAFVLVGKEMEHNFDSLRYRADEIITPQSRTFIPSRVYDNPYLAGTGYMTQLQALPEPLRSQMLYGDFKAGMSEDPWQVCPTEWVDIAMRRWKKLEPRPRMDSTGTDPARGGKDNTIIARRHGWWFDEPLVYPGKDTPDGPLVAGLVVAATRDRAPAHIDVIGIGASPYDFLVKANQQVIGVNVSEAAKGSSDKSGRLSFFNMRSYLWWRMRELLDPDANNGIALPPDTRLRADLCTPRWELRGKTIYVESREDLLDPKRLGRSPDWASAYILASIETPRVVDLPGARENAQVNRQAGHNPYIPRVFGHDPYKK